jgi:outer membrane assembly lipoprotein YfiO
MQILIKILFLSALLESISLETKPNQSIAKKTKSAYPVKDKSIKEMSEDELKLIIEYAKEKKDSELAFTAFYYIMSVCQDHVRMKSYKLDLADYTYSIQSYEKAAKVYEEFCLLYPGSQESEYAQYKLVLCTFYISLEADRDQSDTTKTINLITHFLPKAKDQKYIDEAQSIFKTCRKRLFVHEVVVLETYLKQKKFTAAKKRLEYMEENFKDIVNVEKYLAYLQKAYEVVKDPKTRPFYFTLDIEDALKESKLEKKKISKKDAQKAVSFFVA